MKNPELVQINFFRFLINDLNLQGGNVKRCIKRSKLNLFNLEDTDAYVPLNCMYNLFDELNAEIDTEDFISFFHHSIKVQNLHNYGSFMLSAPDILGAANFSIKFTAFNYTSEVDGLEIKGPITKFWIDLTDKYQPGKEHASALQLAFILDHLRLACGENWAPLEIHYPFDTAPNIDALLPDGHQVKLKLNAEKIAVYFPTSVLKLPVSYNDHLQDKESESFPFRLETLSTKEKIEQILEAQIPGYTPTLPQLSNWFETSPRSIQRLLGNEQTSYFEILDQWRFKKAIDLLENSKQTSIEISQQLGYQKAESFHRTFKRWTGLTPQQYREAL